MYSISLTICVFAKSGFCRIIQNFESTFLHYLLISFGGFGFNVRVSGLTVYGLELDAIM